jgi:hypothetical protein
MVDDSEFMRLFDEIMEQISKEDVLLAYMVICTLTITILASAVSHDPSDLPNSDEISKAAQSLANDFAQMARDPSEMREFMLGYATWYTKRKSVLV